MLVRRGYDSDPVKSWKEAQNKGKVKVVSNLFFSEDRRERERECIAQWYIFLYLTCLRKIQKMLNSEMVRDWIIQFTKSAC